MAGPDVTPRDAATASSRGSGQRGSHADGIAARWRRLSITGKRDGNRGCPRCCSSRCCSWNRGCPRCCSLLGSLLESWVSSLLVLESWVSSLLVSSLLVSLLALAAGSCCSLLLVAARCDVLAVFQRAESRTPLWLDPSLESFAFTRVVAHDQVIKGHDGARVADRRRHSP